MMLEHHLLRLASTRCDISASMMRHPMPPKRNDTPLRPTFQIFVALDRSLHPSTQYMMPLMRTTQNLQFFPKSEGLHHRTERAGTLSFWRAIFLLRNN